MFYRRILYTFLQEVQSNVPKNGCIKIYGIFVIMLETVIIYRQGSSMNNITHFKRAGEGGEIST
jgi:hypothetical protein